MGVEKIKIIKIIKNCGIKKSHYPVGLLTEDELSFAGHGNSGGISSSYLYTARNSWSSSPYDFTYVNAREFIWLAGSGLGYVHGSSSVRPVVSLVPGTRAEGKDRRKAKTN